MEKPAGENKFNAHIYALPGETMEGTRLYLANAAASATADRRDDRELAEAAPEVRRIFSVAVRFLVGGYLVARQHLIDGHEDGGDVTGALVW